MRPENPSHTFINTLSLLDAVLCADCEMISDSRGDCCLVCGSRSLLNVSRVLGGSAGAVRAQRIDADAAHLRNAFTVLVNPEAANVLRSRRWRKAAPEAEKNTG